MQPRVRSKELFLGDIHTCSPPTGDQAGTDLVGRYSRDILTAGTGSVGMAARVIWE